MPAQIVTPADPNRNSVHAIWDFTLTVFQLPPQPLPPARGAMAFKFDAVVFCLAGVGLPLRSFYVVDVIQLNSNFVRMFGREVTEWNRSGVDRSHRSPLLTEKELSISPELEGSSVAGSSRRE